MDSEYDAKPAAGSMEDQSGGLADFMIGCFRSARCSAPEWLCPPLRQGEKTRKELGKKSKKWKKQAEDLRESGGEWFEDAGERAGLSSEIADAVEDGLQLDPLRRRAGDRKGREEARKKKGLFR